MLKAPLQEKAQPLPWLTVKVGISAGLPQFTIYTAHITDSGSSGYVTGGFHLTQVVCALRSINEADGHFQEWKLHECHLSAFVKYPFSTKPFSRGLQAYALQSGGLNLNPGTRPRSSLCFGLVL